MINTEKLFYFLVIIFILLLISSIYKMYFVKEGFDSTEPANISLDYHDLKKRIKNIETDNNDFREKELNDVKKIFIEDKDNLYNNIARLNDYNNIYSDELKILSQKNIDYTNDALQIHQNIQNSRVGILEEEISKLTRQISKTNTNFLIKSIVCKANSAKLNIHPITLGMTPTDEFLIFLNNRCLSYKIDATGIMIMINDCEVSDSSNYKQNFKFKKIRDFNEYNQAINIEPNEVKSLVMKTDDIIYPFYIVQPVDHEGKCLYVLDNNKINIKTITKSPFGRFRASNTIRTCE